MKINPISEAYKTFSQPKKFVMIEVPETNTSAVVLHIGGKLVQIKTA